MKITRTSIMTGITRTIDLDITLEQIADWRAGTVAQDAFPHLSPAQREFLITGTTQEEWNTLSTHEEE